MGSSRPTERVGGTSEAVFEPLAEAVAETSVGDVSSASGVDPTQVILGDFRAARITPDEAVRRLTAVAVDGTHCPPALRPRVEAHIRDLLAHDPLLAQTLRRMGATVPDDKTP